MAPNLSKQINKTILACIPAISEDGKCRPYKLTGVELVGLWLENGDLATTFLTHEHRSQTPLTKEFFIPFSQIACVAVVAPPPPGGAAAAGQSQVQDPSAPPGVAGGSASMSGGASRRKSKTL
jgi:hypothetical protein